MFGEKPQPTNLHLNFIKKTCIIRDYKCFLDGNQNEPIISQAIKKFDIDVNILFADFNNLSKKSLGRMIIEIRGDQKALEWIRSHNVEVKSFLNPTQKDEK